EVAAKALDFAAAQQLIRLNYERLPNIESQGLLLAGVGLLHRQHKVDFEKAKEIFEHLAERHPKNPLPYTWLAAWRVFNVTQSWFNDFETESRIAVSYAERALDLNAEAPLAHSVRGLVATNFERQFDVAERHFESALKVDDCDAMAWLHRGVSNAFIGDGDVAVKYTTEARRLSPLDPWRYYFDSLAASAAFAAADYKLAVECGLASLRANRFHLSTLRVLAMSYAELGDQKAACAYLERVLVAEPTLTVSRYLQRSPSAGSPMAMKCANALRKAGLTE
ncbi:MAG: tetratricopeptide repeat protein, partial [Burkholderiales bacterium]